MTTRIQARDEIQGLINTALAGATHPPDQIVWPGVPADKPAADQVWVRVTLQHTDGGQSALGRAEGARRYTYHGLVWIEIYTPMGDGLSADDDLAIVLLAALRAARTTNGAILRNASAREAGPDGGWSKTVVQADFEYDEVS